MRRPAPDVLIPLLDYLARAGGQIEPTWQGWQIRHITGGGNNLLYRANGDEADLAIKFTIRDARDRAGREYEALLAIQQASLPLAPKPIFLERDRYPSPVVVQTWLEGAVMSAATATDADWEMLLEHYLAIHRLTPAMTPLLLREAVLTMRSAEEGRQRVHQQIARIPPMDQPATLRALLRRLNSASFPDWPAPLVALCRSDPNASNFIRRAGRLFSVDWENGGWGDPAFEIADLLAHPAYAAVPASRWEWVIPRYAELSGAATIERRIRAYYLITLVWWVARFARRLYEIPRGLDQRLAKLPTDWQADAQAKYDRYVGMANALLD